ncbi:MAG: 2-methylfumaryl-CoA isomerase [Rhodobacteraceae bacterium]|nr:2-methylfumaryl-CoA isomerase [Paracoccaceae bacterium]
MSTVLSGMRVVEGSAFVAVPLAGMTLAQMGADVIRFDRIEGGLDAKRWPVAESGQSHFWAGMNKGKRSIAVNMRSPEGKELITRVITAPGEDAGLFISNLRVRGWMDHETLSQHRNDLIMVTLMGDRFGRPAVDYTVNPALGIPHITGPEGHPDPVANALPAWDLIAGNMVVSALLAAERRRLRTGMGDDVELSLKDVAAANLGHLGMIGDAATNPNQRGKSGNDLYGAYGHDFLCADGQRVMVIGLTDRQWKLIVDATQSGEAMAALEKETGLSLKEESNRWALRRQISSVLEPWFAKRNLSDFAAEFDKVGLTWSVFRSLKDALEHDKDLTTDNPMFTMMDQQGLGRFPVPASPVTFAHSGQNEVRPAPRLGEHTEEILSEVVGADDTEIAQLFDKGIVSSQAA